MQQTSELYKIIIALVVVIIGSWGLFGWIVKRWINSTESGIKELYESRNNIKNDIIEVKTRCEERHK